MGSKLFLYGAFVIHIICYSFPISSGQVNCDKISKDSPWEDQKPIHPCHYITHVHPRQQPRKNRTETEIKEFHHLAIFNIRYDLDFQEAGDPCSVRLQQEWFITGGATGPVPLSEYSFNRIWYKRLCNFFSFLECIPKAEVRFHHDHEPQDLTKSRLHKHENHTHAGGLPDSHNHLTPENNSLDHQFEKRLNILTTGPVPSHVFKTELKFNGSGRDTFGMYRMRIGGRGPGKGRHKSGPGVTRVDPSQLLGLQMAIPVDGYPLDGICVCSYQDPEFPERKRPDYGIDFVEDEAREDWCVAAPGNLCGRVYFKRNLWPGQSFELSDHIGCPKMYRGEEYECIRWQKNYANDPHAHGSKPLGVTTSTCEKKLEDPKFRKEAQKAAKRRERRQRRLRSLAASEQNEEFRTGAVLFTVCLTQLFSSFLIRKVT